MIALLSPSHYSLEPIYSLAVGDSDWRQLLRAGALAFIRIYWSPASSAKTKNESFQRYQCFRRPSGSWSFTISLVLLPYATNQDVQQDAC
jgi:hypothetical protein